jgi:hypothetical protein
MLPAHDTDGNLPPGIHEANLSEIAERFARTAHRDYLMKGLIAALCNLKGAGCRRVFLDGSFVTSKVIPEDYDGCWDISGVDPNRLDPVLLTFDAGRAAQKAKYFGEMFPAQQPELASGNTFLEFFQIDRVTGLPKGIVVIDLQKEDL